MNLDRAIEKHTQWKIKIRSAISNQETLDVSLISKDYCVFIKLSDKPCI